MTLRTHALYGRNLRLFAALLAVGLPLLGIVVVCFQRIANSIASKTHFFSGRRKVSKQRQSTTFPGVMSASPNRRAYFISLANRWRNLIRSSVRAYRAYLLPPLDYKPLLVQQISSPLGRHFSYTTPFCSCSFSAERTRIGAMRHSRRICRFMPSYSGTVRYSFFFFFFWFATNFNLCSNWCQVCCILGQWDSRSQSSLVADRTPRCSAIAFVNFCNIATFYFAGVSLPIYRLHGR